MAKGDGRRKNSETESEVLSVEIKGILHRLNSAELRISELQSRQSQTELNVQNHIINHIAWTESVTESHDENEKKIHEIFLQASKLLSVIEEL